jgi:hypothetical protein
MHALEKDIAKYKGRYNSGYDELRKQRVERMRKMGLIDPDWELTPTASAKLLWPLLSKGDLGILRFANVLAVALLVSSLIQPQARFWSKPAAWPFLICGRNSLHIFCLGILLSVVGHMVLNEFFGGIALQFAVSAAGVAIMIAVAALLEWLGAAHNASGGSAVEAPTARRRARG